MNCFNHAGTAAVGSCTVCQKAICHQCVARESPRLICSSCASQSVVFGYEYKSDVAVGGWPLVHVCMGVDPVTMRPKTARGVIAIGNVAVGLFALGGLAFGAVSIGGVSIGLALAFGGVALGTGVSLGGLAVGSVAVGGAAIGAIHAIGGSAIAPSIINGRQCDQATRELVIRWLGQQFLFPSCRF